MKAKYPEMGLSPRNLWDMRRFYLRYNEEDIKLRQAVAVSPWSHNLQELVIDEIKKSKKEICHSVKKNNEQSE